MIETKEELVKRLLDKKAKENNQIDLNAYALGLEAMYEAVNYTHCCTELKDRETMTFDEWVDAEGYYEKEGNWFNKHGYSRDMKKLRKWYGLRDCF